MKTRTRLCGCAVAQCLPVLLLSQMWLVYLALIEALEILPWHVSTGCCPWPAHRRTPESSAQGTIHTLSSCMQGGFTAAAAPVSLLIEREEMTASTDLQKKVDSMSHLLYSTYISISGICNKAIQEPYGIDCCTSVPSRYVSKYVKNTLH